MIKPFTPFLKSLNKKICCFITLIIVTQSCFTSKSKSEYLHLEEAMHHLNISFNTQSSCIIILDDEGCMACNNFLGQSLLSYSNSKKVKYIISANKNKVDLSGYINLKNNSNIYFDAKKRVFDYLIKKQSCVYFIKNAQIDSVIYITANNVDKQLQTIKDKIECL